ncbi:hypothetical protein WA026_011217, partial [Henosepilachna vigintioctopunctata]
MGREYFSLRLSNADFIPGLQTLKIMLEEWNRKALHGRAGCLFSETGGRLIDIQNQNFRTRSHLKIIAGQPLKSDIQLCNLSWPEYLERQSGGQNISPSHFVKAQTDQTESKFNQT